MGAQPSVFPHSTSSKGLRVCEALHAGRFPRMRQEGTREAFSLDRASLLLLLQSFDIRRRAEKLREAEERARKNAEASDGGPTHLTSPYICTACIIRRCEAQVMRKDAVYFSRECESLEAELSRILDSGGRRVLANFIAFSSAKLSPGEMQEASPYPSKPPITARGRCSNCRASEAERDAAHAAACISCYKLEGLCAFLETHAERIQAAAALYSANTSRSGVSVHLARRPRAPAAAGSSQGPQQRALSLCGPLASNAGKPNEGSSNSSRRGPRVRRAETESMVAAYSREPAKTTAAPPLVSATPTPARDHISAHRPSPGHSSPACSPASSPPQPLTAALSLLTAPLAQGAEASSIGPRNRPSSRCFCTSRMQEGVQRGSFTATEARAQPLKEARAYLALCLRSRRLTLLPEAGPGEIPCLSEMQLGPPRLLPSRLLLSLGFPALH
ncbi:hypothetical protein cyc_08704 [Cyclospora cayetanensis]|uniref:Uncharacterized protein n=1 Tax=Cyclospora cayetanensis TaxID=88456 RepID=A0A1D3D287_9EIME|nr:hypothetical protein cyc_08704 [Cyclospora cayetanensis]